MALEKYQFFDTWLERSMFFDETKIGERVHCALTLSIFDCICGLFWTFGPEINKFHVVLEEDEMLRRNISQLA